MQSAAHQKGDKGRSEVQYRSFCEFGPDEIHAERRRPNMCDVYTQDAHEPDSRRDLCLQKSEPLSYQNEQDGGCGRRAERPQVRAAIEDVTVHVAAPSASAIRLAAWTPLENASSNTAM